MIFAQPQIDWDRTWGGDGWESCNEAISTIDNGILVVGNSNSTESYDISSKRSGFEADFLLIKTDLNGNKLWDRLIGGFNSDVATSVAKADAGSVVVAGYSNSDAGFFKSQNSYGKNDFWVVKVDAGGNKLWDKTFGGSGNDQVYKIVACKDGGFILVGFSDSPISGTKSQNSIQEDIWVVKIDANGNKLWDKSFNKTWNDRAYSACLTNDDGVIIGGQASSTAANNRADVWLLRIDKAGGLVWEKVFKQDAYSTTSKISATKDGGAIVSCKTNKDNGAGGLAAEDGFLIRIDGSGNKLWDKIIIGNSIDDIKDAIELKNENIVALLQSSSSKSTIKREDLIGKGDIWLVFFNKDGTQIWDKTWGGTGEDVPTSIMALADNTLFVTAVSNSGISGNKSENFRGSNANDIWVIKTKCDYSFDLGEDKKGCAFSTATLSANFPDCIACTYSWEDGSTGATHVVAPTKKTIYTATVSTFENCKAKDSITFNIITPILTDASFLTTAPSCSGSDQGSITLDKVTGGIAPYKIAIKPSSNL